MIGRQCVMTATVGHLGQVIAIVVVVLIGLNVVRHTAAQPSKPAISRIGLLKLRWVALYDSGRVEGEWRFAALNSSL